MFVKLHRSLSQKQLIFYAFWTLIKWCNVYQMLPNRDSAVCTVHTYYRSSVCSQHCLVHGEFSDFWFVVVVVLLPLLWPLFSLLFFVGELSVCVCRCFAPCWHCVFSSRLHVPDDLLFFVWFSWRCAFICLFLSHFVIRVLLLFQYWHMPNDTYINCFVIISIFLSTTEFVMSVI